MNIIYCDNDTLVERCRQAHISYDAQRRLIMKYIQHMTIREIAHIECVDEQAIKMTINRSLKRLKNFDLIRER